MIFFNEPIYSTRTVHYILCTYVAPYVHHRLLHTSYQVWTRLICHEVSQYQADDIFVLALDGCRQHWQILSTWASAAVLVQAFPKVRPHVQHHFDHLQGLIFPFLMEFLQDILEHRSPWVIWTIWSIRTRIEPAVDVSIGFKVCKHCGQGLETVPLGCLPQG